MTHRINDHCRGCGQCYAWCPTRAITGRRKVGYQIQSERCVDCGVCGRICTFEAVLTPKGTLATRMKLREWPKPQWDFSLCNQCGKCIDSCPVHCVSLAESDVPERGLRIGFPFVARLTRCLSCGFCLSACDLGAVQMIAAV